MVSFIAECENGLGSLILGVFMRQQSQPLFDQIRHEAPASRVVTRPFAWDSHGCPHFGETLEDAARKAREATNTY
ncbi:MAG: hypothetical protein WAV21_01705 [Minisyncoccia bacterium]